jgi:hypothetical protein
MLDEWPIRACFKKLDTHGKRLLIRWLAGSVLSRETLRAEDVTCPICGVPDTDQHRVRDSLVSFGGAYEWVDADTLLEPNLGPV